MDPTALMGMMGSMNGQGGGAPGGSPDWLLPALMGTLVGVGSLSDKRNVQPGSGATNAMMLPMMMAMMKKQKRPGDASSNGGLGSLFPDYSSPAVSAVQSSAPPINSGKLY